MKIIELYIIPFICFCLFLSCSQAQFENSVSNSNTKEDSIQFIENNTIIENNFEIDSSKIDIEFLSLGNYDQIKENIKNLRIQLSKDYLQLNDSLSKNQFIDSISVLFTKKILNEIVPHWYGTEWDFNGHTSSPSEGTIACGYFVSTTLRDMGIKVNRYRLAQQNPENEGKTIAIKNSQMRVINEKDINSSLEKMNEGLYFVGLDNHVGYLYLQNNESYFLHSNYIDGYVMIEKTSSSTAFQSSVYHISPISNNRLLIQKWLLNEEFKVMTEQDEEK